MTRALGLGLSAVLVAVSACGASAAPAPKFSAPPVNAVVDYQIGGAYTPASSVQVVIRDREDPIVKGKFNVCYINAFQTQAVEESFWLSSHSDLLLHDASGALVEDENWPGEYLLDTRTESQRSEIASILGGWIDGCAKKGFKAIDPDNLDTYSRSDGLLSQDDNLALVKLIAARAHAKGLSIGQKNASELGKLGKAAGLDFVVTESCQVYDECSAYTSVFGRNVIEVEYTSEGRANYAAACKARGKSISIVYRDPTVKPKGTKGYLAESC